MALPAGRKGVATNQVDSLGKIKGLDIPIATPSKAGTVKPVSKTAGMTQDVGIDSNGKLYTQPGNPVHEYKTTEQIIGKWIDGKDLYEIVIELTSNTADVSELNIDKLIHIDALGSDSAGYTGNLWTICSVSGASSRTIYIESATNKISIGGSYPCTHAILQYTKGE